MGLTVVLLLNKKTIVSGLAGFLVVLQLITIFAKTIYETKCLFFRSVIGFCIYRILYRDIAQQNVVAISIKDVYSLFLCAGRVLLAVVNKATPGERLDLRLHWD